VEVTVYRAHIARWLTVWLLAVSSGPVAAQQKASLDEIRVAVAGGDYRGALAKIDKLLFPTSSDPAQRYELLMLKGECQLQLKNRVGASSAFKSAAKVAADPGQLAAARANALITDASSGGQYKPRAAGGGEPIDILPMESRKRAMMALRDELSSRNQSQIDGALRAQELPPIEKVFTAVADMYALELFASGGEAGDARKLMQELGTHAYTLMEREISKSAQRVDYLVQLANSSSDYNRGWNSGRLGLTSQQRDEVKSILTYLDKIRQRASEYRRIAARVGGNEAKWDALVANTVEAMSEAESLYNDR
jgi:hypothetical protein